MDVDKENLNKLTDDELFKTLKKYGITVGPITSTTRSIYEKKLRNYLDSLTNSQTAAANKTLVSDKKAREKELKEQKLKEQQLKEQQMKEQQMREQQLKEQQAKEQQMREQQLREQREHQLREQQLQEKLREQQLREEKLKEQLREQQLREQQLKEQQQREQQLREYREQQLREQQMREQQLREQQLREQQMREQLLREQQLKEQQLREQQTREQQLREQQLKEKQLREQQAKEQQMREQQLKEQLREQQMREQQLKEKLREQQIKEQQLLKEQQIKEEQQLRKRREEELERERQKEIEREMFERLESNKQAMYAKAKALETKGSNIPRLAEPTTSKLYPTLPTQPIYPTDYSSAKSTSSISITKTSDLNPRGGLLQNNEKLVPSSNHLKSMAISKESRNNDSNYQSMISEPSRNDTRSQFASQAANNLSPIRDKFAERLSSYGLYKGETNTTLYTSTLTSPTNIRSRPPLHQGAERPTLTSSNSISSTSEFNAATGSSSPTKQAPGVNQTNYKYFICVFLFTIIAYFFVMQFQNPENPI